MSTTSFSPLLASEAEPGISCDGGRAARRHVSPSRRDLLLEQLLMLNSAAAACWAGNKKGQIHVYSSQRYKGRVKKKQATRRKKNSRTQTFLHHEAVFALRCSGAETYVNQVLSPIVLQPQRHNRCRAARKSTCLVSHHNLLGCLLDFTGFADFFPQKDEGESDLLCFLCRRHENMKHAFIAT